MKLVLGLTLAAFATLAALALTQTLGGSGGEEERGGDEAAQAGNSPEAEVGPDDVVKEFSSALVAGDSKTACGEMTTSRADQFASDVGVKTCEKAVETSARSLAENASKKDLSQEITDSTYEILEESEDSAVVRVTPPPDSEGSQRIAYLLKEDGTWLIEG